MVMMKPQSGAMTEQWRVIPGTEGRYFASDLGRIASKIGVRKLRIAQTGYVVVSFRRAGRVANNLVHSLLAAAFIGPRPDGHDVDHIDHDPTNNALSNLRYLPIAENRGSGHGTGNTKLTEAQVREILALPKRTRKSPRRDGNGMAAVAARYGVTKGAIADILSGRNWANLSRAPATPKVLP